MGGRALAALIAGLIGISACASTPTGAAPNGAIRVVAAENFWGNVVAQLGGSHVAVRSIISDSGADPHLYESDARDSAAIADARLVVENGLGYDDFIDKLLASSSRKRDVVLSAAAVLHAKSGSNPHLWYDIPRLHLVAQAIADRLTSIDPNDATTFATNLARFDASLHPLLALMDHIKTRHAHAAVAYTERVPGYLFDALGLDVKTPSGFARAIEDGNEPSAGDTHELDDLLRKRDVRVLVYNAQTTSPVTQHARDLARHAGIPVVAITETLPAAEPDYQHWQLHQLQALQTALGG